MTSNPYGSPPGMPNSSSYAFRNSWLWSNSIARSRSRQASPQEILSTFTLTRPGGSRPETSQASPRQLPSKRRRRWWWRMASSCAPISASSAAMSRSSAPRQASGSAARRSAASGPNQLARATSDLWREARHQTHAGRQLFQLQPRPQMGDRIISTGPAGDLADFDAGLAQREPRLHLLSGAFVRVD